ncbi:MAG: hypothetical protein K8S87_04525, partial [Planctomycetes bacterium]|nr:hypothetical protein [Planctomycetota bacterium]
MSGSDNMPTADRDIEFCEKAINAGYIVKEIVPSILRKLNEKRIKGEQSSIGQELISLDLMSSEQVKEILLMLENVELTCENCGKKYIIRAYDPGRQYACKECGAYLEPADADLRVLKHEQSQIADDEQASRTTSSSIGDPNPQLADLLPPMESEVESGEKDDFDDPILASARRGSLKEKGVIGENVFALDDEMLSEKQNEENNELNKILGIDAKSENKKMSEKPSLARERKIEAQKKQQQAIEKQTRQMKKMKMQEQTEDSLDQSPETTEYIDEMVAKQSEKLLASKRFPEVKMPTNAAKLISKSREGNEKEDIEQLDKQLSQSEFLKMIDPEKKDEEEKETDETTDEKDAKKPKKMKVKSKEKETKKDKSGRMAPQLQKPVYKTEKPSPINYIVIFLVVLLFAAVIGAFMMLTLWNKSKTELSNSLIIIKTLNHKIKTLEKNLKSIALSNASRDLSERWLKGHAIVKEYKEKFSKNPTSAYSRKIAELIETNAAILHPVFALDSAEFYQRGGLARKALILLKDMLSANDVDSQLKVRLYLKIAEIYIFDLNAYDLDEAIEYINDSDKITNVSEDYKDIISVWKHVLDGKQHDVLSFDSKDSYENNIAFLLNKFSSLIPSLYDKYKIYESNKTAMRFLEKALLLYTDNYSIDLIDCLNVVASGDNLKSATKFEEFQKKYGVAVYSQELLSRLYIKLENFVKAEKVLTWLINSKKDLTEREKQRDTDYFDHRVKRANCYVKNRKLNEAIKDLDYLISNPMYSTDSYKFRIKLGDVYLLLGKYADALKQFVTASQHDSGVEVTKRLIRTYIELERLTFAKDLLKQLEDEGAD